MLWSMKIEKRRVVKKKIIRVLLAVLVFNSTVLIHELGHLEITYAFHIDIDTFSLGFGPKIVGWQTRNGLEIRISAIPLGGYIRISPKGEKQLATRSSIVQTAISSAGIVANWTLPLLMLWIFSPRYRKSSSASNTFPETILRKELLETRKFKFPLIGPFFMARALYTPIDTEHIVEEYAWKFNDFSRIIGFMNLFPILPLDGGTIVPTFLTFFIPQIATSAWGRIIIIMLSVTLIMKLLQIQDLHPRYWRKWM